MRSGWLVKSAHPLATYSYGIIATCCATKKPAPTRQEPAFLYVQAMILHAEQQAGWVFEQFFHAHQERHRFAAVDDAVVVA